ncbi:hypothetical protein T484DRAFT_2358147 [Baffinella frigidus]|nr:hypothetical protein T484DRAFT_2358147 [Cryptophyta sp. CCMP2293]
MLIYKRKGAPDQAASGQEDFMPPQFEKAIRDKSKWLVEAAKAEATAFWADKRELGEIIKKHEIIQEEMFKLLTLEPGSEGYWVPTVWLQQWLDVDPLTAKCDKVSTGDIASNWNRPDPRKLGDMKVVSAHAWEKIVAHYSLEEGHPILETKLLCVASVKAECKRRHDLAQESAESAILKELCKEATPQAGVWVSKAWLNNVMDSGTGGGGADPDGADVVCCSSETLPEDSAGQCKEMRLMTGDKSKRRLISLEAFNHATAKHNIPGFAFKSEPCIICRKHEALEMRQNAERKQQRAGLKAATKTLWSQSGIKLVSGKTHFLITDSWVQMFFGYIQVTDSKELGPIDNSALLDAEKSSHARLLRGFRLFPSALVGAEQSPK